MNYRYLIIGLNCIFIIGCTSIKNTKIKKYNTTAIEKIQKNKADTPKSILKKENGVKLKLHSFDIAENNGTQFMDIYDPWEPFNRRMYVFNYYLDKYFLLPVVNSYEFITPKFVRKGVSNFFSNLQEISTFINSVLQMEGNKAIITLIRFAINSTVGVLGLFDVASHMDLPQEYEDLGLTLAKYGVGQGPYLVLPGLGPSNLRDITGKTIDMFSVNEINPYDNTTGVDINDTSIKGIDVIDIRYKKREFKYFGTQSPFEYEYIRYFYTEYRNVLIQDIKKNN